MFFLPQLIQDHPLKTLISQLFQISESWGLPKCSCQTKKGLKNFDGIFKNNKSYSASVWISSDVSDPSITYVEIESSIIGI